jgi:hypothetical protein
MIFSQAAIGQMMAILIIGVRVKLRLIDASLILL